MIGVAVAYWYLHREGDPQRQHDSRGHFIIILVLAWMWPILLLAMLVNRPDKIKPKDNGDRSPD